MIDRKVAATLALYVYDDNVEAYNLPRLPDGWSRIRNPFAGTGGFAYGVFRNDSTNEIVISYRGTDGMSALDDVIADINLTRGVRESQAVQAARVYGEVLRLHGADAAGSNITFTGHSLGGGLASIAAVWFNRPAIVFDPAPFALTARHPYRVDEARAAMGNSVPEAFGRFRPIEDYSTRALNVTGYYAKGEFLEYIRAPLLTVNLPGLEEVEFGNEHVSAMTMHSQALLTAGLMSEDFRKATLSVQSSLPLIMSGDFYSPEPKNIQDRSFLVDLIRTEQASPGDSKLSHFSADLHKIGTNIGGLNRQAQDTLIAHGIEWYYWQGADYAGQEFFTASGELLQYTTAQGDGLAGALNKAHDYVFPWLQPIMTSHGVGYRNFPATIEPFAQWNVATGSAGSTAVARAADKTQAFIGGGGADVFTGGANNDVFYAGAGDDTLDGSGGKDKLYGGDGADTYRFSGQFGHDLVVDSDGKGLIRLDGTAVTTAISVGRNHWGVRLANGQVAILALYDDSTSKTYKKLEIARQSDAANRITIANFDAAKASGGEGYLGLKLDNGQRLALLEGGSANVMQDPDFVSSSLGTLQGNLVEGAGKTYVVYLGAAAKAGDTLTLSASGEGAAGCEVVLGDITAPADGAVISLIEGQTMAAFSLVQGGGLEGDQAVSLSVSYQGQEHTATSNTWAVTLKDAGETANIFLGDQRALLIGTETRLDIPPGDGRYGTYAWSETRWGPDGTLINGVVEADFADVIYGAPSNDRTSGLGGNDALGGGAGNDEIDGGVGDDLLTGGSGSDHIMGGEGNDFISSSAFLVARQRLRPDDAWAAPAGASILAKGATWGIYTSSLGGGAIWDGVGSTSSDPGQSDVVDAGAGNDNVLASWGGDRVEGGDGDDVVWGLAGADILEGGDGADVLYGDGDVLAGFLSSVAAAHHAADFLDGGAGDDTLVGNGGADQLFGGAGNDEIAGDASGPTGAGDFIDPAYHGADFLDGEDGDDLLEGGGEDDTLYGGLGADVLVGDTSAFNVIAAHQALIWGDDYLDGEDGDDLLVGGGGADWLYGGAGRDFLYGDEDTSALPEQFQGQDYLDGEAGDDVLFGGGGADILLGGDDNDILVGDASPSVLAGSGHGDDYMEGGAGNDQMVGYGGADVLFGGAGNDLLLGDGNGGDLAALFHGADHLDGGEGDDLLIAGGGDDLVFGGLGHDELQGGAGQDRLDGQEGNDRLFGQAGDDVLVGADGDDVLVGGAGDDLLEGGEGSNQLWGEAGHDILAGGAGSDHLSGGLGDDILVGGGGNDVYYYNLGEGTDRITDSGGMDWLVFSNVLAGEVEIGVGSLKISLPGGGSVHLDDFDPAHPLEGAIEWFQFADGVFSRQQLIELHGFTIAGTPEADTLTGTALADAIDALQGADLVRAGDGADNVVGGDGDDWLLGEAGDDSLQGGEGNDLLAGGAGSDRLQGGAGDDTFVFARGDGQDTVVDASGSNQIQIGGAVESELRFSRSGTDLVVAILATEDRLTISDWFAASGPEWGIGLDDGTFWDRAAVESRVLRNQPPVLVQDAVSVSEDGIVQASGNVLANDADPDGRPLRVTNPGVYAGGFGSLHLAADGTYRYDLANGSAGVQALAAGQQVTDTFVYAASDDDPDGAASSSSSIVVTVRGSNDAPVAHADQAFTAEDGNATVTGNVLDNDRDIDAGALLQVAAPGSFAGALGQLTLSMDGSYAYTLANGSAAVQALGRGQQATDSFVYHAFDGMASTPGLLQVHIEGRNDAPVVASALPDQTAAPNKSYLWQIPAGSFSDPDAGDTLLISASLADGSPLPDWLAFDTSTLTFTGRVPRTATGFLDIQVTATDRVGNSADLTGSLAVSDVFRLGFDAAAGGGGGGGGGGAPNGNEGVGNGLDPAPPGHGDSFNDGPGTGPGDPGARDRHGNPARPEWKLIEPLTWVAGATGRSIDHRIGAGRAGPIAAEHTVTQAGPTGFELETGTAQAAGSADFARGPDANRALPADLAQSAAAILPLPWASTASPLAGGLQLAATPWSFARAPASEPASFFSRWNQLDERLAAHFAAGLHDGGESEPGAGPGRGDRLVGSLWGPDPINPFPGSRASLPVFQGLSEGRPGLGAW